jgi:YbbR domain-containing protein
MSLFDPHSPGHDGAVIIESGVISQFGVRLPLSKSGQLSNNYGTRHHAAMGLSEVTDALVLLVSEERKRVSLFLAGKMIRVKDKSGILTVIRKHLEEVSVFGFRTPSKSGFSSHAAEIVLSFLGAILFCATVVVSQAEIREKAFSVPVEYLTSEDTALGGEKVSEVMVHLKGPKSELDLLGPSDLSVRIDLKKTGPGIADVMITDENVKLPRGISLLDVQPDSLKLAVLLIQEKEAIVDPQLVGSLPQGLKLVSIRVVPGKVKVLSPEGEPGEEEPYVTTTPIYLDGIKRDTKILCKIVASPSIQPVKKTWPDAEVEIVVSTKKD